jgi:5-methylcytosine-specific restriction endonuclease McrA
VPKCPYPISGQKGPDKFHLDHIRALVNGGSNNRSNLQILRRIHNLRKNKKDAVEWAEAHGVKLRR